MAKATGKSARAGAQRGGRSVSKSGRGSGAQSQNRGNTSIPRLPYTTRPNALRSFLSQVPNKPKPPKVNQDLLASWDIRGNDVYTIIRVLKALGFLNASNEPTDIYVAFMDAASGPAVLAERVRETYAPLFHASREPHRESSDKLRNLFNIHSGGAEGTIAFQIQTFKALCDYADFSTSGASLGHAGNGTAPRGAAVSTQNPPVSTALPGSNPTIHIDLHIHLPENKTSRDYQYIIQDIARFIYRYPDKDGDRGTEQS